MNKIAQLLISIGVSVEGADKAQKDVEGATGAAEDTDRKGSPKLKAFAKGAAVAFAAVGAAAVGATAALLAASGKALSFATEHTASMDAIAKGSKKLAVSSDEYQRWQQIAEHTGTSFDALGGGVKKLNAQLLTVAQGGGKEFSASLAEVGLSASQLEGKSTIEQIGLISDALMLVTDESERSARAAKIFGESAGPELANIIAAGSNGINDMAASAKGVFTPEDLAKAESFQDTLTDFTHVVQGIAGELAVSLAPALQTVANSVTAFVDENQELIKQQLPKILKMVVDNATKLLPVILRVAGSVADLAEKSQPMIEQFLTLASGAVENGMDGILSVLQATLPVVMAIAGTIGEVVGNVGILNGYNKGPRGAPKFLADEAKEGIGEKSKKAAGEGWARERHLSEQEIQTGVAGMIDSGEVKNFDEGVAKLREDYDPVLSFADMGKQAKAKAARDKATKKGKGGGKGKPKAEKVDAHFGDYRDVLATFEGKDAEASSKALESLTKGTMPADHKPETSIQITNHVTTTVDVGGITVTEAGSAKDTAKEVEKVLRATYKRTAAATPSGIVR